MKTMFAAASAWANAARSEKPVARVDRLGAGRLAGLNDLVDHEIGLSRGRGPDGDRLIGHLDMERVFIGFRIDSDRIDAHAARGLDDAAGDSAPVGDEDLLTLLRIGQSAGSFRSGVLLEGRGRVNVLSGRRAIGERIGPAARRALSEADFDVPPRPSLRRVRET